MVILIEDLVDINSRFLFVSKIRSTGNQKLVGNAARQSDGDAFFVDAGIDDLRRRYNEANITLTGRQSILVAAREMQNLGAKTSSTRSLPELPTLPMDDNTDNDTNPEP